MSFDPVTQFGVQLARQRPSLDFATPEQIGALTAFLSSDAAAQLRPAALAAHGGWVAQ